MISTTGAYWILLAFGSVAVAVHAYRLFGTSLPGYRENGYSIVALTPVLSLGSPRGYLRGFLVYLLVTEAVFFILSTSSTILEMTYNLEEVKNAVGALARSEGGNLNPAFPVAASTVLITLSTIKPFSDVEQAIRRAAHRLAGIPRSFFDIVTKVRRFDYQGTTGTLSRASSTARSLAEKAKSCAEKSGVDEGTATDLAAAVVLIYALEPWTLGRDGERIWSQQARHAFHASIEVVKPKFDSIDLRLRNLIAAAEADEPQGAHEWELLEENAEALRSDIASIFALLYLSEPAVHAPKAAPLVRDLLSFIRSEPQRPWVNLLSGTIILGTLGNLILVYLVYLLYGYARMQSASEIDSLVDALPGSLVDTIRDVIEYTTIFASAAIIALLVRGSKLEIGTWRASDRNGFPFADYAQLAIVSFACTLIAFLAVRFVVEVILIPGLEKSGRWFSSDLVNDFGNSIVQYSFYATAALPCAWYAALVADNLNIWPYKRILAAGFACSAIVGLISGAVYVLDRPSIEILPLLRDIFVPSLIVSVYFIFLVFLAWQQKTARHAKGA